MPSAGRPAERGRVFLRSLRSRTHFPLQLPGVESENLRGMVGTGLHGAAYSGDPELRRNSARLVGGASCATLRNSGGPLQAAVMGQRRHRPWILQSSLAGGELMQAYRKDTKRLRGPERQGSARYGAGEEGAGVDGAGEQGARQESAGGRETVAARGRPEGERPSTESKAARRYPRVRRFLEVSGSRGPFTGWRSLPLCVPQRANPCAPLCASPPRVAQSPPGGTGRGPGSRGRAAQPLAGALPICRDPPPP